jgi:hypothetical protein
MNKTLRKGFVGLLIASILLMTFMPNITHAETGLTLEKSHEWVTDAWSQVNDVAAGDIDGDNIIEIITVGHYYNSTTTDSEGEANLWNWNGTHLTLEHATRVSLSWDDTQFNAVAIGNVDDKSDVEVVIAGSGRFLFPLGGSPPKFAYQVQGLLVAYSWNGSAMNQKAFTYWPNDERFEAKAFDVAIGDVDQDGVVEIVTVGYQNTTSPEMGFKGQLCIWNITGSDFMLEQSLEWPVGMPTEWHGIAIADVDNDDKIEITVVGYTNDTRLNQYDAMLAIFSWNGTTLEWEKSHLWYTFGETYVNSVVIGDIDNDGVLEIITGGRHWDSTSSLNAQLRIWSWDGDNLSLETSREWGTGSIFSYSSVDTIALGDIDNDGSTEIVTGGYDGAFLSSIGQLRVWSWDGAALFLEDSETWSNASTIKGLAINDVDFDTVPEIVTGGYYSTWLSLPKSELAIWSVSKFGSSITVDLSSSSIVIGNQVTISGSVTNETGDVPIPNMEVNIEYSREPLPVLIHLTTVVTNENGEYSFTWTPPAAGNYTIMVSWKGDFEHEGATATTTLIVEKTSSLIALTMSSYNAKTDDEITINGILYPEKAATITIQYTMPNGTIIAKTVDSTTAGTFSDTFKANQIGEWTVKASWDGDDQYKGATSAPLVLTVQAEDQTTPLFAMTGLGLGIIALIVALVGVALALRKKTSAPPSPPTATPSSTP